MNKSAASKYLSRLTQKTHKELDRPEVSYALNDGDDIFVGDAFEKAQDIVKKEEKEAEEESSSPSAAEPRKKKGKKAKVSEPKSGDKSPQTSTSNGLTPPSKKAKKKLKTSKSADEDPGSNGPSPTKKAKGSPLGKIKKIKNKRIASMKLQKAKLKAKVKKTVDV